jgi:hypothetical protein
VRVVENPPGVLEALGTVCSVAGRRSDKVGYLLSQLRREGVCASRWGVRVYESCAEFMQASWITSAAVPLEVVSFMQDRAVAEAATAALDPAPVDDALTKLRLR